MIEVYENNKKEIVNDLKILWDYMVLNQHINKCDIIIGCGCANLDIPIKCAELYKNGYTPKILFAGGFGKITKDEFAKTEAEIYKDIALKNGVLENDIILETKSTNTGDNFRFAEQILKKNNIKAKKILIVHKKLNERRTFSSAKAILKDKEITITSPDMTFEDFINFLDKNKEKTENVISVLVGDIQRIVIYPQFGWQQENEIPKKVIDSYTNLKKLGYNKYILSEKTIKEISKKEGLEENIKLNTFN